MNFNESTMDNNKRKRKREREREGKMIEQIIDRRPFQIHRKQLKFRWPTFPDIDEEFMI